MRRLLFVVILGACTSAKPSGPAWPKMAETDPKEDGGESIDPRESNAVAAVIEKSEEPAEKKTEGEAATPAAATTATDEKPAVPAAPTTAPTDEVITTEEIIIEIDDDD
jgi:hypothetical protein